MFIIISDNEKYNLELKELANMLFAYKKKVYLFSEIEKQNLSIDKLIQNQRENSSENIDIFEVKKSNYMIISKLTINDDIICKLSSNIDFKEKHIYKKLLYQSILSNYDNIKSKWGILTGIRPVKIINELKKDNKSSEEIDYILKNNYLLSYEKISLIKNISDIQDEIKEILADDISIYISIPFCPSRCNYCSFFSMDINLGKKYIKEYLINLDFEIKQSLKKSYFKNKNISSIYVGGGTPSSLDKEELKIFFKIINDNFDTKNIKEFTFEAGRVDTLNEEKLEIIKSNNVSRISINPQSMNDDTLVKIGRKHSSNDVKLIYKIAREIGFDNINMDIILGLADESISDMDKTVDEILLLNPESITVHCLAIKRASDINTKKLKSSHIEISDYMQKLSQKLSLYNYMPYYLYRQKNMLENGENIGFCKKSKYSLYNVAMMDELQSIIGFGASSSSKILDKKTNLIKRIPNYKDVILYNNNIKEILKRKEDI